MFVPKKEHYEAQKWCFQKGFKISLDPIKDEKGVMTKCRIKIKRGRDISYGKKEYTVNSSEFTDAVWNLYLEVYNKYKHILS